MKHVVSFLFVLVDGIEVGLCQSIGVFGVRVVYHASSFYSEGFVLQKLRLHYPSLYFYLEDYEVFVARVYAFGALTQLKFYFCI